MQMSQTEIAELMEAERDFRLYPADPAVMKRYQEQFSRMVDTLIQRSKNTLPRSL